MENKKLIFLMVTLIIVLFMFSVVCFYFRPQAVITYFSSESDMYNLPSEPVFHLKIKNTGNKEEMFWVYYQIQDKKDNLSYEKTESINLQAKYESSLQTDKIVMPQNNLFKSLAFEGTVSIWSGKPNAFNSFKLDSRRLLNVFLIPNYYDQFNNFNKNYWNRANYTFDSNRGYFHEKDVITNNGFLILKSPANTFDGAGIESVNTYDHGSFSASVICPYDPGTLCTFFLYQPNLQKKSDEIDIEVYNDGSKRVDLVTYIAGKKNNYERAILPFDPSADFHEYHIDYHKDYVSFYADGKLLKKFTSLLPTQTMKIMSNFWWPNWMSYPKKTGDKYMSIDWIKYYPDNR